MAKHPEVQRKAQAEIDRVVGSSRLPDFEDRPALPYLEAIYREVMRWSQSLPVAIAHASTEDDYYKGYFIPKGTCSISFHQMYDLLISFSPLGTAVFGNVWFVTQHISTFTS